MPSLSNPSWESTSRPSQRQTIFPRIGGIIVLFLPLGLSLGMLARNTGSPHPVMVGGIAAEVLLAIGLLRQTGFHRIAVNTSAIPLYLVGLFAMWGSSTDYSDWFLHTCIAIMLGVPLFLYGIQEWLNAGGYSLRRARMLAKRLACRSEWPENLLECKTLPEVKALREALRDNVEPALGLLVHPSPQVRIAALAAMEFRPFWEPFQAETVLRAARYAKEPQVRAAALMALANCDDKNICRKLLEFLRDNYPEVRMAAAEAMMLDAERRWPEIRDSIRLALADPRCRDDGPLPCMTGLPEMALVDLTRWSSEPEPIATRSILTLISFYRHTLQENLNDSIQERLIDQVVARSTPSALRVELAYLLEEFDCFPRDKLELLLGLDQPSSLRLLATHVLLRHGSHERAIETLRELARVPNRSMAIATAQIIQKYLRVDMGLPINGTLPDPQSKHAAEIARKVLQWATHSAVTPPTVKPTRSVSKPTSSSPVKTTPSSTR